ncbi:MAG: hypothetical protein OHK0045_07070 [Raineya sp.]
MATFSAWGQNVEVNSEGFPLIRLKTDTEKKLSKENVKITQKGQNLDFEIVKQDAPETAASQEKSVYFLIETSGFTSTTLVNNCKTGISDFIRKSPDELFLNAASFWKANAESKVLNNLSVDFTNKKEIFVEEMKQKIKPVIDSQQQADVHKAIYEAIEYVSKTATTPEKQIVLLTAGVNKSYSPIKIEDCIEKATQNGVQVFSLVYKTGYTYALDNLKKLADKTQAKSQLVGSSKEITDALEDFLKGSSQKPSLSATYEISFTLPKPEDWESISISIDEQSQNLSITPPIQNDKKEKEQETPKNSNQMLFLVAGILALAALGFFLYKKQQQIKQEKEEEQKALKAQLEQQQQQSQQEQEQLQQSKQVFVQEKEENKKQEPQKFDPKKTYIGGGGGTPTLVVSGGGFQQKFLLHKPSMTIGRKEGNDIVIPVETVSSNHAILTNEGGNWFIADNNSTNGIILNGNRIQKHILKQGDKIQLGGVLMSFQLS